MSCVVFLQSGRADPPVMSNIVTKITPHAAAVRQCSYGKEKDDNYNNNNNNNNTNPQITAAVYSLNVD
jgi:hypothetical protein